MVTDNSSRDGWSPCPQGTLTGLAHTLKRRERTQRLQRISALVAVFVIAVSAGAWFSNQQNVSTSPMKDFSYGGITCTEVRQSLPGMMSGQANPELQTKLMAHLAECPSCAELARRMQEQIQAQKQPPVRHADLNHNAVLVAGEMR